LIGQFLRWVREHKSSAAGLVLVVLGCWALLSLSRRVHHLNLKPPAAASVAAATAAPVAAHESPGVLPSTQAGTERMSRTAAMRGEFENAARYVDFIQQAMSRPQEGGKFYALMAWKRCSELAAEPVVATTHTGSDAVHDAALALAQDLVKRCGGVLEAWPTLEALYKVVAEQRGGRDFLLPEDGRGIVVPGRRESANADIDAALKSGDRWAAAAALQANVGFLDVGNSTGDEAFDRQLRELGAEIVACELVGDCRGGVAVALHCASSGDCVHDDWRDVVLAQVPDTQRVIFDTMLSGLHARVGLAPGMTDARP
jgi:hypothetical protein